VRKGQYFPIGLRFWPHQPAEIRAWGMKHKNPCKRIMPSAGPERLVQALAVNGKGWVRKTLGPGTMVDRTVSSFTDMDAAGCCSNHCTHPYFLRNSSNQSQKKISILGDVWALKTRCDRRPFSWPEPFRNSFLNSSTTRPHPSKRAPPEPGSPFPERPKPFDP